jgi:hypothetical protein
MLLPPLFTEDPWPAHERRLMAHVLPVPAGEIGDPVAVFVLMKPGDRLMHSSPFLPDKERVETRRLEFDIRPRPCRTEPCIHGGRFLLAGLGMEALRKAEQRP